MRLGCVAFVIFFLRRCLGDGLIQNQLSLTSRVGRNIRITCDLGEVSTTVIHWYRQPVGQRPVRILYYSNGVNNRDDGFGDRFGARNVGTKQFVLKVNDIKPEDSATYYCAYWDTQR